MALKEQLWQGRAGTIEQGPVAGVGPEPIAGVRPKKDLNAKLKSKKTQRGDLPPLTDGVGDSGDQRAMSRGQSAPESLSRPGTAGLAVSQESDDRVMSAILRARSRATNKAAGAMYDPLSEAEINLFNR